MIPPAAPILPEGSGGRGARSASSSNASSGTLISPSSRSAAVVVGGMGPPSPLGSCRAGNTRTSRISLAGPVDSIPGLPRRCKCTGLDVPVHVRGPGKPKNKSHDPALVQRKACAPSPYETVAHEASVTLIGAAAPALWVSSGFLSHASNPNPDGDAGAAASSLYGTSPRAHFSSSDSDRALGRIIRESIPKNPPF